MKQLNKIGLGKVIAICVILCLFHILDHYKILNIPFNTSHYPGDIEGTALFLYGGILFGVIFVSFIFIFLYLTSKKEIDHSDKKWVFTVIFLLFDIVLLMITLHRLYYFT